MPTDIPPKQTATLAIDQTLQQAVAQHQTEQSLEVEKLYQSILQIQPNHPVANHNMGVLAVQSKQAAASLSYFMAALEADPACAQYWLSYIDALLQADQLEAAREVLALAQRQGLQGDEVEALVARVEGGALNTKQANAENLPVAESPAPEELNTLATLFNQGHYSEAAAIAQTMTVHFPMHAFGWMILGAAFNVTGRRADALAPMRKAAVLSPNDATVHSNLGNVLHDMGQLGEAETSYRRALQINPNNTEVHNNLGNTLQYLGRLNEAEACFRRTLQIKPDLAEAQYNLSNILKSLGRLDEAETRYRRALQIKPDYAAAHNNLGATLMDLGRLGEAEISCRQALQLKPDYAEAHCNLGTTLQELGRLNEAEASYRRALQINPNNTEVHNNLGTFLLKRGLLDDATACFRQALEVKPDYTVGHSNLIFALDMMLDKSAASLLEERKRWDAMHAAHLHQQLAHANSPDPERRLRIGYVSADLRDHSAIKAFGGMLTRYDRSQFEVFAYSNFRDSNDRFTELFKQNVTVWRNIIDLQDDAVAKMIREDQIDILVDLSGHSGGNRLLVFARKPAPIQITAWGYASGTGMQAMDVLFTDQVMVPPEDKQYFTEEVRYLPCMMGAFFNEPFPDVNELPALSTGTVTFGSFNRLAKISPEAYQAWAEVLLAVPRSRLVLKIHELSDPATRESVLGHFTKAGVAADRIIMQGNTSWHEHMQAYHQVDIGLDPFPQGGGVTALEGLMMGVPMINLLGATLAGRSSASIMTTLGLTDWIVETPEQYVELAIQKASDLQSLAALRQQLRGIFTASVIGDQAAYARVVEQEYRQLWQEWCSLA